IQRKEPLIELARLGLQDKPEQVPKEVKIIDWGYYKDSARPRRPVYKEFNKLKQQKDQSTKLSKEKFRHLLIQDLSQEYLLQLMAFLAKPHLQFSSSPIS